MRIAYLDCASGLSGDMMLAALVAAGAGLDRMQAALDSLGVAGLTLRRRDVLRCGFACLKIDVVTPPEHAHRTLPVIERMLAAAHLTDRARSLAVEVFRVIGAAEAKAHGLPLEEVHFHEVGAADSIADITAACVGWDELGIAAGLASPVPVGGGTIRIAHGRVAVPAPATAEILRGVPLAASDVAAELTTPTGAALVKVLARSFGPLPAMTIESIGLGAGTKDFSTQANVLRLIVGEADEATLDLGAGDVGVASPAVREETVWRLETQLDDVPGELVGHTLERCLAAGALDAYTTAVGMKKGRPGVLVTVFCRREDVSRLETLLFRETGTLGVRRAADRRRTLARRPHVVATPWGDVAGKLATLPGGEPLFSPEYESCRELATRTGRTAREVMAAATAAFDPAGLTLPTHERPEGAAPARSHAAHDHHSHDHHAHDHHAHDHHFHDHHSHDHHSHDRGGPDHHAHDHDAHDHHSHDHHDHDRPTPGRPTPPPDAAG